MAARALAETTESDLIRDCAPLYGSFASEAVANIIMFVFFSYVFLVIKNRQMLRTPGTALARMMIHEGSGFLSDVWTTFSEWTLMPHLPLPDRFRFCRKLNEAIATGSALVAVMACTRILHIGNVNGFRYLGYALTCPIMQLELVVLIAPVVPCFKLTGSIVLFVTFATMVTGYAASLISGNMWNGDLVDFVQTWDFEALDINPVKFWWAFASFAGVVFLSFIEIPYLALLQLCATGKRTGIYYGYYQLLAVVSITWLGFPIWWYFSFEGMGIITNTQLNGFGFAFLNIFSKGMFSYRILRMVKWHMNNGHKSIQPGASRKDLEVRQRRGSRDDLPAFFVPLLLVYDDNSLNAAEKEMQAEEAEQASVMDVIAPRSLNPSFMREERLSFERQRRGLEESNAGSFHRGVPSFNRGQNSNYPSFNKRENPTDEDEWAGLGANEYSGEPSTPQRSGTKATATRQNSHESYRPSMDSSAKLQSAPSPPATPPEPTSWYTLTPAYQKFLVGAGMDPVSFQLASLSEKVLAFAHFQSTLNDGELPALALSNEKMADDVLGPLPPGKAAITLPAEQAPLPSVIGNGTPREPEVMMFV